MARNEPASVQGHISVLSGSVNSTGSLVLAANDYRKWGVLIQNTDTAAADGLRVGTTSADCTMILAALNSTTGSPNTFFIPGTSSIFLQSTNGSLTTDYSIFHL